MEMLGSNPAGQDLGLGSRAEKQETNGSIRHDTHSIGLFNPSLLIPGDLLLGPR